MSRKLQVKRGKEANLPTLAEGEFGFLTDKKKLYIGSDSGNVKIPTGDAGLPVVNITSTDGIAYTGELPTEPYIGLTITVIPDKTMVVPEDSLDYPTLNGIEIMPSYLDNGNFAEAITAYIRYDKPLIITYTKNGSIYSWKINGVGTYRAEDLVGTVPISKGGTGATTKEEAQANLGIPTSAADIGAATTSDLANYLPLTGGTLSGSVEFGKGTGMAGSWLDDGSGSRFQIETRKKQGETKNRRILHLYGDYEKKGIDKAFMLLDWKDGKSNGNYTIFGEHNTSLLASTIQKLIQNGGLSTLQGAIKTQAFYLAYSNKGIAVSATGKGILHLYGAVEGATITVDNKEIGEIGSYFNGMNIPFTESISIDHSTVRTGTGATTGGIIFV